MKRATRCYYFATNDREYFNPRPREEGDVCLQIITSTTTYFNPRPREEGDIYRFATADEAAVISIHALVKRATGRRFGCCFRSHISIHALVKRATNARGGF